MVSPTALFLDGLTDVGGRRQNNEDAWWAGRPGGEHRLIDPGESPIALDLEEGAGVALVSDGVGGANAGEVASSMAVSIMAEVLRRDPALLIEPKSARSVVLAAMREAHEAILTKAAEPAFEGMGATLSAVCFTGRGAVCWAQAGDSRIYVFRGGQLRQISRDHSPVGRMRQAGRLSEAEARRHPARNQIDLSMGDRLNVFEPDSGIEEVHAGDVFLLCSDGLSDGLWDREIAQALASLNDPAELRAVVTGLVEGAKKASGNDNITALVALVSPGPGQPGLWQRLFG